MVLAIAHRRDGRLVPMKVRSDIGAESAARLAHEALFQVREPDVVRPRVCAAREGMAALEVRANHQETARTG